MLSTGVMQDGTKRRYRTSYLLLFPYLAKDGTLVITFSVVAIMLDLNYLRVQITQTNIGCNFSFVLQLHNGV